ncbi:LutC/YkgG family protein [Mucilaginibacter flavidus]|uniref:LutC/YkgG family protein n=1 Tax=Mucilaginibacter flavidus TaxID=2949309 RepID=UPI0020934C70|nr:LUD domain-containing protein [Mucilaginibacter flavidus]MCO5946562.1 LUD domain-containing protein [Mucilaginibacter flavidus]
MSSRNKILTVVAENQPRTAPFPEFEFLDAECIYSSETFINVLTGIGGTVIPVETMIEIQNYIFQNFNQGPRTVTNIPALSNVAELMHQSSTSPHALSDVDYAVIDTRLAVAENGAVWVTEKGLSDRVLPFICQHLAVVLNAGDIVSNMHAAYEVINADDYGYGTFIAGPSKTADIEQSLVLGAHGPKSMTVFLMM